MFWLGQWDLEVIVSYVDIESNPSLSFIVIISNDCVS